MSPAHLDLTAPTSLLFEWQACTDPSSTSIGIEWEPESGAGLFGEVQLDPADTQYGPIALSPDTPYDVQFTFDHGYSGTNADGIPYSIDTDAELDLAFHAVAEPAAPVMLALGGGP